MKLKLSMIQYDALPENIIPLDENVYTEDIRRDDDDGEKFFSARTHFRYNKKFFNVAFEMQFEGGENPAEYNLAFSPNDDGSELINFRRQENFFYDISTGEKDFALGAVNPGVTYIYILKNGKIFGKPRRLLVTPSSITMAEFKAMIDEIKLIRSELIQKIDVQGKSALTQNYNALYDFNDWKNFLESLNHYVKEIFAILQKIDKHPRFGLKKIQTACKLEKIRKFDGKIIRQYVTNPQRKKYFVSADEVTYNIFENRFLRDKISKLREWVLKSAESQKLYLTEKKENISDKLKTLNEIGNQSKENRTLCEESRKQLVKILEKVERDLKTDSLVTEIISTLDKCLSLNFLRAVEKKTETWLMTQIFTNDANYHAAYIKLNRLNKILDFSFTAQENLIIREKLDVLYEYWILAKILKFLICTLGWQHVDGDPIKILRDFFDLRQGNYGRGEHILLTKKNLSMEIFYNTEIRHSLGGTRKLRPDYLFKVSADDAPPKIFILDAKYRNYGEQGFGKWLKGDLRDICIKKYIHMIEDETQSKVSMSFIVHSDKTHEEGYFLGKYVVYNGTIDSRCREVSDISNGAKKQFGSFYLLPNVAENGKIPNQSEDNLILFFEMMFEYFIGQWKNICWQCGAENVKVEAQQTKGNRQKFYMKCQNCGAFWVKTHCGHCKTNLIKHFINYHVTKDMWNVCCPKCGNGA